MTNEKRRCLFGPGEPDVSGAGCCINLLNLLITKMDPAEHADLKVGLLAELCDINANDPAMLEVISRCFGAYDEPEVEAMGAPDDGGGQ